MATTDTCTGSAAGEATCSSSTTTNANAAATDIDCRSQVKLFDGFPSDVDDNAPIRSISLADNGHQTESLSRISRYDRDMKLRQLSEDRFFHIAPNGDHMGWVVSCGLGLFDPSLSEGFFLEGEGFLSVCFCT